MINSLRPGFQFNQYQLLEQIGIGGQAVVWSAEDVSKQNVVAIKFNDVPENGQEQIEDTILEQQLQKLVLLRHPHILPIYDFGLANQVRYLVSPYIAGGSLFEKIKQAPLQLAESLRYVSEIASALDFLHGHQIIHRDLKPANVLMDLRQRAYLADFGLARALSTTTQAMHTGRGTPPYAPPEQHMQQLITVESDVFSFGIMLYEFFTGQLPWNGDKMLGMQQLYSEIELPDPCEINPQLPPLLNDVLRRTTSANPALRPSSAGEVARVIARVFNTGGPILAAAQAGSNDRSDNPLPDASILLDQKMNDWNKKKSVLLDPTRFAVVQLHQKKKNPASIQGPLAQFLLYHSVTYGYHDADWWLKTSDPRDRASTAFALLEGKNEVVVSRVIEYLFDDQSTLSLIRSKASVLAPVLLELALKTRDPDLSTRFFSGLRLIAPQNTQWNDLALPSAQGVLLGRAALEDTEAGDQAIQLVAHLRSRSALEFILKNARNRLYFILLEIQNAAGSLPSFVGSDAKTKIFLEWVNQQITTQPARLAVGYATALMGSTMGIAFQIYLTYRLPNFMDLNRISNSLIQGLIIGFVFSLGIFVSRLVVERFKTASFPLRFSFASITGALAMSSAMLLFHFLFLTTAPAGFLIPAGCFLIAVSFSLGRLVPWRVVKIFISTAAVFTAIIGTWLIHLNFSTSITDLTPLFLYDNDWSFIRIAFAAFSVAIWMGVLGNIPQLDLQKE